MAKQPNLKNNAPMNGVGVVDTPTDGAIYENQVINDIMENPPMKTEDSEKYDIKVLVLNKSNMLLPKYETVNSAGLDVRANLTAPTVLPAHGRMLIGTGLFIAIPEGYECQVRPRSGLALKHGITVLNTPGTIDAKVA